METRPISSYFPFVWMSVLLFFTGFSWSIFSDCLWRYLSEVQFGMLHVIVHISLLGFWWLRVRPLQKGMRKEWVIAVALCCLYGFAVQISTLRRFQPLPWNIEISTVLIPLTILTFTLILPQVLQLKHIERLFRGYVGVFAVCSLVTFGMYLVQPTTFMGRAVARSVDGRGGIFSLIGFFGHRNTLGSFLIPIPVMCIFLFEYCSAVQSKWWVRFYSAAFCIASIHLVLTFSRASQIATAVSLIPLCASLVQKSSQRVRKSLVILAVPVLYFVGRYFWQYALQGRETIWLDFLKKGFDHCIFGHGLHQLSFAGMSPHNFILAQWAFFGGFGLLTYILLIVSLIVLVRRNFLRHDLRNVLDLRVGLFFPSCLFLVFAYLIHGMFEYMITFPIFLGNSVFLLFLGLATQFDFREANARKELHQCNTI